MQVIRNIPHSPYFIFIKGISNKTDETILQLFGFQEIEQVSIQQDRNDKNCIYFYKDGDWVHLMDNYYYTHWHLKDFNSRIYELGKEYEIFTCRLKDVDESYDFIYFKNGKLKREYLSYSPDYTEIIVTADYGDKLAGESVPSSFQNDYDRPLLIAKGVGIRLAKTEDEILCYKVKLKTTKIK